jgi:hypothetical protein
LRLLGLLLPLLLLMLLLMLTQLLDLGCHVSKLLLHTGHRLRECVCVCEG